MKKQIKVIILTILISILLCAVSEGQERPHVINPTNVTEMILDFTDLPSDCYVIVHMYEDILTVEYHCSYSSLKIEKAVYVNTMVAEKITEYNGYYHYQRCKKDEEKRFERSDGKTDVVYISTFHLTV